MSILEGLPTDKLHKFLTLLAIVIFVTAYKVQEGKTEKIHSLLQTILAKNVALNNMLEKTNLLIKASVENDRQFYKWDSIQFSKEIKNLNKNELLDLKKHNRYLFDSLIQNMGKLRIDNAKFEADINSKQREIDVLDAELRDRQADLANWKTVSLCLNILALLFFIFGIWQWFFADNPVRQKQ